MAETIQPKKPRVSRNPKRDEEIRKLRAEGKTQRELAEMYNLTQPRICQILGG